MPEAPPGRGQARGRPDSARHVAILSQPGPGQARPPQAGSDELETTGEKKSQRHVTILRVLRLYKFGRIIFCTGIVGEGWCHKTVFFKKSFSIFSIQ